MPKPTFQAAGGAMPAAKRPKKAATMQQMAAMEFEPWKRVDGERKPPTPQEWAELFNPYGVTIRFAWAIVHKTKPELMKIIEATTDDDGRTLMQGFISTKDFLEGALALLNAAEARYLCAGSALELEEGGNG